MLETKGTMLRLVFSIIIVSLHYYVVNCEVTYYPCSNKTSQKGESIQVVKANVDEKTNEVNFEFNSIGLESILLRQEIRNKELIVLSITGDYRKGKSFLLSLLLQYLEGGGKGLENSKINLDHGFHWRGGSERDTGGMLMWSEPFCVKTESGKELAILLMDTQGANDGELSAGETATVFGLSFLTSSVILYNQQKQIQDNDLQILKVFAQYGGIITGNRETNHKPFQKLVFLIRDWPNPDEYNYGEKGGNNYIEKKMENTEKLSEDSKKFRHQLSLSFTNINGFLMPHPGLKVANGKFTPQDIEETFIDSVNELAAVLFKPENTMIKQVVGKNINGEQMFEYFKTNMNTFKKTKIKMTDFIEAKCESDNLIAFGNAKVFYTTQMSTNCSDESDSMEPNKLRNNHVIIRNQTIEQFNQSTNTSANICGDILNKYLTDLVKWLEEQFRVCSAKNQIKRLENVIKQLQNSNKEIEQLKNSNENVTKKLEDQQLTINIHQGNISRSEKEIDRLRNTADSFNNIMSQVKVNEVNINNSNEKMQELKITTNTNMEQLKITTNTNMEQLKITTNTNMEQLKSTTNTNMEQLKITTNTNMEQLKSTTNTNMEQLKNTTNASMEQLNKTTKQEMKNLIDTTKGELNNLSFIYTQLPNEVEPKNIWPSWMSWIEVTSQYAGLFFRAEGGDSDRFGNTQSSNTPFIRIEKIGDHSHCDNVYSWRTLTAGTHSIYSGSSASGFDWCMDFFVTENTGENRPINKAVRIWKRIRSNCEDSSDFQFEPLFNSRLPIQAIIYDIKYETNLEQLIEKYAKQQVTLIEKQMINNNSNATVEQTISNSRTITEEFSYDYHDAWSNFHSVHVDLTGGISAGGSFFGLFKAQFTASINTGYKYEHQRTIGWATKNTTTKSETFTISKTVKVPPNSRIKVFSYVNFIEKMPVKVKLLFRITSTALRENLKHECKNANVDAILVEYIRGLNSRIKIVGKEKDALLAELEATITASIGVDTVFNIDNNIYYDSPEFKLNEIIKGFH